MVVKGTAPEECSPQMKKLRKNPMPNTMLGYSMAVWSGRGGEGGARNDYIASWWVKGMAYQGSCLFPVVSFESSKHPG